MNNIGSLLKISWFFALILLVASCSGAAPTAEVITQVVKETSIVTQEVQVMVEQTVMVVVTATPEPPTSMPELNIIYSDDFTDEGSGWSTNTSASASRYYEGGMLNIEVNEGFAAWSTNPELQSLDDFVLDVDTKQVDGGEDGLIGVQFRYQDSDNSYRFLISNEGYCFLMQERNGDLTAIAVSSGIDYVNKNSEGNQIQIIAEGSKLSAYVNGELTMQIFDDTFRRGDITLFAVSTGDFIKAAFDNIVVTELR